MTIERYLELFKNQKTLIMAGNNILEIKDTKPFWRSNTMYCTIPIGAQFRIKEDLREMESVYDSLYEIATVYYVGQGETVRLESFIEENKDRLKEMYI